MVFANCSVIVMIDHTNGFRNVKKHINRAIQEISDAAMTNAVRAEELTVIANELSMSTDGVSH